MYASPLQIAGSIVAERNRVNERHVDAHPVRHRAELLQLLPPLQRRRRQGDEPRQSLVAIRMTRDVVHKRPRPGGGGSRGGVVLTVDPFSPGPHSHSPGAVGTYENA